MLFNSVDFAVFLPIVFILYWFVTNRNIKLQNLLVVIASLVFYGWWDWRFLSLILFSILTDYFIGIGIGNTENNLKRKVLLWTSVVINLTFLGFFKYYNFFVENFVQAFKFFGSDINPRTLDIILPVGISFYTFQTMSYTIDIYKRKFVPTKDFIAFAAFVSFFPLLVAGPIERAKHLLPQFFSKRKFEYTAAVEGLRQILWGLFKKVVIADNCAMFANEIFNNSSDYSGSTLVIGALFFTFQIYGDFSGYSDMALGISRLFGFNAMKNFAFPYFSRDIAEFWRRWHISLSTWFRDYLYIPLGGSMGGTWMKVRNTFIIFIVSGFWHGANWTFIVWGSLNAIYFLPLLLTNKNRSNLNVIALNKSLPNLREFLSVLLTFSLTVFAWIFFRAENLSHAFSFISGLFTLSFFQPLSFVKDNSDMMQLAHLVLLILFLIILEWRARSFDFALSQFSLSGNRILRRALYTIICISIIYMYGGAQEFIYFAF